MKLSGKNYKRIVIKIGSSLLVAGESGSFSLEGLAEQVEALLNKGKEIIIISSGAIAKGLGILKLKSRPKQLALLQALAACGQHVLMGEYQRVFEKRGLHCAQVLLTWDDLANRKRCLNAKNTLLELLRLKLVPIVNENDTISSEEIKFGDNDKLSALVASNLVSADLLIILSDVDGLLDADKKVVRVVDAVTPQIKRLACPTPSDKPACVGGMITKLDAAKIAMDSGIPCVIANGRTKNIVLTAAEKPQEAGTFFVPNKSLTERERWLAFGTRPKGRVIADEGALRALLNKKSLLSVGVLGREGDFECGDIVSVIDAQGIEFARGRACVSCKELDKVKGKRSEKEVMHCDNMVIL
ncbi:MAG: glutamate 5-kinase [Candidatus Omnitrophica bacterium]|nr:glutamate 5-kinase [Candidatus Omnitrophota bacterium]